MPATVYLVTGGARSGKSSYAERLCERLCPNPLYLATAGTVWSENDDDFAERIKKHQQDRAGKSWTTIEEPLSLTRHAEQFSGKVKETNYQLLKCIAYLLASSNVYAFAFRLFS
jgi:adenosylcobinamide kinase/adenosylcobinamide-phosphate guanylyltransferase